MFHVDHLKSSDLILNYVVASFSEEWLKKMDANKKSVTLLFEKTYGAAAHKWWVYWRTFFIAVAELFNYSNGEEWMVTHYLFKKKI